MTQQLIITTLFQPGLRNPFIVEEANDIGEEITLGVDALGIGLQIKATDPHGSNPGGRLRINAAVKFDPRLLCPHLAEQLVLGDRQHGSEALSHVLR